MSLLGRPQSSSQVLSTTSVRQTATTTFTSATSSSTATSRTWTPSSSSSSSSSRTTTTIYSSASPLATSTPVVGPSQLTDPPSRALSLIGLMIAFIVVYIVLNAGRISRLIRSHEAKRGWLIRKRCDDGPSERSLASISEPSRFSRLETAYRAYYNRYFLRVLPFFSLTVGQLAIIGLYLTAILCALLFEFDKATNPTRPARLAISQLPLQILLICKNGPLLLTGKSYEKLQYLHRVVGLTIVGLALGHGIIMIRRANANDTLDFVNKSKHGSGLAALLALCLVALVASPLVRRRCYQAFLSLHILGYLLFSVAICIHSEYAQGFVIAGFVLLMLDGIVRSARSRRGKATLSVMKGGYVKIEVEGCRGWRAGQHVRIRVLRGTKWLESHPLTIARTDLRDEQTSLIMYAKGVGKWSRSLAKQKSGTIPPSYSPDLITSKRHSLGSSTITEEVVAKATVLLQGPYGFTFDVATNFETVVLIAGGSGITFVLSYLDHYVAAARIAAQASTTYAVKRVKVVWSTSDAGAVEAFADLLDELVEEAAAFNLAVSIQINITQDRNVWVPTTACEVEMGRPVIGVLIERMVEYTLENIVGRGNGMYVAVCGPRGLITASRNAVANLDKERSDKVGGVVLHSESFDS